MREWRPDRLCRAAGRAVQGRADRDVLRPCDDRLITALTLGELGGASWRTCCDADPSKPHGVRRVPGVCLDVCARSLRYLGSPSKLEARPGIEPGCEDLQSSTSPLRHRASMRTAQMLGFARAVNRDVRPTTKYPDPPAPRSVARAGGTRAFATARSRRVWHFRRRCRLSLLRGVAEVVPWSSACALDVPPATSSVSHGRAGRLHC